MFDRDMWFLWVLGIALVLTMAVVAQVYPVYAAIDAQLNRAQVSSSLDTMAANLEKVRSEMEKRGITHGHAALIFKSPENDIGLDHQAIVSLRDRAASFTDVDTTSTEYNVALNDIRGTAREIEIEAWYWYMIRSFLFWITVIFWIAGCWGLIVY